jgi:hypothetical protein
LIITSNIDIFVLSEMKFVGSSKLLSILSKYYKFLYYDLN